MIGSLSNVCASLPPLHPATDIGFSGGIRPVVNPSLSVCAKVDTAQISEQGQNLLKADLLATALILALSDNEKHSKPSLLAELAVYLVTSAMLDNLINLSPFIQTDVSGLVSLSASAPIADASACFAGGFAGVASGGF